MQAPQDDDVWLAHLRWVSDHTQARADRAAQSLWGLLGLQAVLVSLVAPAVVESKGIERWLLLAAVLVLTLGCVKLLFAGMPRRVDSINVSNYQAMWTQSLAGAPPDRLTGLFVEELLQAGGGGQSPIQSSMEATQRRLHAIRWAIVGTVTAVVLVGVRTFVEVL